jgi:hypothetical protein
MNNIQKETQNHIGIKRTREREREREREIL